MIELAAPYLPVATEYAHAAQATWNASRHPENIHDMSTAMAESPNHISLVDKALFAGTAALIGVQMTPANETILGNVGGAAVEHFHNAVATFGATGATVLLLDGAIVAGTAYAYDKVRPAMDIIHGRYLGEEATEASQQKAVSENRVKRALGKFSLAFATGGAGVVSWFDYKRGGQSFKENVKEALPATVMLAGAVGGIAVAGHGVGAAGEAAGHPGVMEGVIDFFKIAVPVGFAGIFGGRYLAGRRQVSKTVNAQLAQKAAEDAHFDAVIDQEYATEAASVTDQPLPRRTPLFNQPVNINQKVIA
jgi:hypothetical protein